MAPVMGQGWRGESPEVKAVWSARSLLHLNALRRYIQKHSPQNAVLIAARIMDAVELLRTQPGMGRPGRLPGTRELVVSDSPYIIPYRVHGDRLELLAVLHGHQKWPAKV